MKHKPKSQFQADLLDLFDVLKLEDAASFAASEIVPEPPRVPGVRKRDRARWRRRAVKQVAKRLKAGRPTSDKFAREVLFRQRPDIWKLLNALEKDLAQERRLARKWKRRWEEVSKSKRKDPVDPEDIRREKLYDNRIITSQFKAYKPQPGGWIAYPEKAEESSYDERIFPRLEIEGFCNLIRARERPNRLITLLRLRAFLLSGGTIQQIPEERGPFLIGSGRIKAKAIYSEDDFQDFGKLGEFNHDSKPRKRAKQPSLDLRYGDAAGDIYYDANFRVRRKADNVDLAREDKKAEEANEEIKAAWEGFRPLWTQYTKAEKEADPVEFKPLSKQELQRQRTRVIQKTGPWVHRDGLSLLPRKTGPLVRANKLSLGTSLLT